MDRSSHFTAFASSCALGACLRVATAFACTILAGLVVAMPGCGGTNDRDIRYIDAARTKPIVRSLTSTERSDDVLVDVRPRADFEQERIAGAVHVALADLASAGTSIARVPALAGKDRIIVYGEDAGATTPGAMAKRLMRIGMDDVFVLQGGLRAWKRAGGEVVRRDQ